jgi:hypothetical protein
MKYRLEVDRAYNVRPKKGERRELGTGRLVKAQLWMGNDLSDCMAQAVENDAACEKVAPGASEVIAVRGYDNETYKIDPLKAVPNFISTQLLRAAP